MVGGQGQASGNVIDYVIIIPSTGNAVDYGDCNAIQQWIGDGCASPTRALFAGGD